MPGCVAATWWINRVPATEFCTLAAVTSTASRRPIVSVTMLRFRPNIGALKWHERFGGATARSPPTADRSREEREGGGEGRSPVGVPTPGCPDFEDFEVVSEKTGEEPGHAIIRERPEGQGVSDAFVFEGVDPEARVAHFRWATSGPPEPVVHFMLA